MDKYDNKNFDMVLEYITPEVSSVLHKISSFKKSIIEEIRLKNNKPLLVCCNGNDYFVSKAGELKEVTKYIPNN